MRLRSRRSAALVVAVASAMFGLAEAAPSAVAGPVPQPLNVTVSGTNGLNRIQDPGRRCADGGSGEYRNSFIEGQLPTTPNAVISSSLPGVIRGNFAVHHDGSEPVGTPLSGSAAKAFLLGTESHVTLSNQRGSVQLRLSAGSCANPTLAFDGFTVSGSGTWTVDPNSTTGSYHPAPATSTTGSGTFTLTMGVAPGADNPWTLSLNGSISVPQPSLNVEFAGSSWGNLGIDYATRRPTVAYRITNTGPGDTFSPTLVNAASTTQGVTLLGIVPQDLPDLASGQSTLVYVRYQLSLVSGPCAAVILNCAFNANVSVSMPDVLDKADSPPPSMSVAVTTPNLPPPLS